VLGVFVRLARLRVITGALGHRRSYKSELEMATYSPLGRLLSASRNDWSATLFGLSRAAASLIRWRGHNEPLVPDGHRQRSRFADRFSCGALSSPLGMSAGWRILKRLGPQYSGKAFDGLAVARL
jgi:hypothetical protein